MKKRIGGSFVSKYKQPIEIAVEVMTAKIHSSTFLINKMRDRENQFVNHNNQLIISIINDNNLQKKRKKREERIRQ